MSDDPRPPPAPPAPPVAIRITRPYATEDELLQREPDTITRTGVTLLGAQSRPQGVVLRFELALANGTPILRGEGRVVGYKPNMQDGLGGLALRFTRLDSRSKSLVDKAATLREQRRQSIPPPPGSNRSAQASLTASSRPPPPPALSRPPPPLPRAALSSPPPPPDSPGPQPPLQDPPPQPPPLPAAPPTSDVALPVERASGPVLTAAASEPALASASSGTIRVSSVPPPPASEPRGAQSPLQAPPGREGLLGRLRARAQALDPAEVARILLRNKS